MDTSARTLAGRYRLGEVIGRGGMSTVYRATDQVLGRTVAVKVLLAALADQDRTYRARFQREARAAAALTNPAVVTVYDTGVDLDGSQYIVMEYVPGHSLDERLADQRPFDVGEALRIAARVADALAAAHAAGILHRDIKPANVMVTPDGSVKVLDFGIARRLDATTLTQTASVVGTAAYMAPERALGGPGDARADIYSLGCLLYAMLTGRPPFTGEAAAAVLHQQVNSDPRAPSRLRAAVPPAVDALVLQMLAKAPQARPAGPEQVRGRLLALARVPAAIAPAGATAPTVPIDPAGARRARVDRAAPVAAFARFPPSRGRLAGGLADHRWRALVMGVATGLVALLAVALLGGGGTPRRASSTNRLKGETTPATVSHHTAPASAAHPPAQPKPKSPTGAPAPPGHGGGPPGHGGQPPGHHGKPAGNNQGDGGGD